MREYLGPFKERLIVFADNDVMDALSVSLIDSFISFCFLQII